jgi:hypothetical protein
MNYPTLCPHSSLSCLMSVLLTPSAFLLPISMDTTHIRNFKNFEIWKCSLQNSCWKFFPNMVLRSRDFREVVKSWKLCSHEWISASGKDREKTFQFLLALLLFSHVSIVLLPLQNSAARHYVASGEQSLTRQKSCWQLYLGVISRIVRNNSRFFKI